MLVINNISKKFDETFTLKPLSITLQSGNILGFIGHNGAGKSTTLNIISGLLKPDAGDVFIDDISVVDNKISALEKLGIVHESGEIYNSLTPNEYLILSSGFYNISEKKVKEKISYFADFFFLSKNMNTAIGKLSKGAKQKILLIASMLHEPSALILDEPFNGFDIDSIIKSQELLKEFAAGGGIVIFSSHILSQIEKICSHLAFIKNGKIKAFAEIQQFIEDYPNLTIEEIYLEHQKND